MTDDNTPSTGTPSQADPPASSEQPNDTKSQAQRSFMRRALYDHLIVPLVLSENPPWYDARGAAVGFFVALGLPLGSHTITMGLLRLVFKFNLLIAYTFSWILNPFTIVPLYYGAYKLGGLLLGREEAMDAEGFRQSIEPILHSDHFIESLEAFAATDMIILERWAVGALCIATITAVIGYFSVLWVQTKRAKQRAED